MLSEPASQHVPAVQQPATGIGTQLPMPTLHCMGAHGSPLCWQSLSLRQQPLLGVPTHLPLAPQLSPKVQGFPSLQRAPLITVHTDWLASELQTLQLVLGLGSPSL